GSASQGDSSMKSLVRDNGLPYIKAVWACGIVLLVSAGVGATNSAQAAVIYNLDNVFNSGGGSAPPVGIFSSPLETITLTDLGNTVRFDVFNTGAGGAGQVKNLYFNFTNAANTAPTLLQFTNVTVDGVALGSGTFTTLTAATQSTQNNMLRADGDGYFDGSIALSNSLQSGHTLSFTLGVNSLNLVPSNFNALSIPGGGQSPGPFTLASQLGSYQPGDKSIWVGTNNLNPAPVPLPPSAALFGSGLLAAMAWLRRRKNHLT